MALRLSALTAALAIAVFPVGEGANAAEKSIIACKATDDDGGSNQLVVELRDGRIHAFRYRRSIGAPRCEIEASRSPSAYSWERFEWIDSDGGSDVRSFSDDAENAHVWIGRTGGRIELRVIDYDQWWHCGAGQALRPVIAMRAGEESCELDP